MTGPEVLVIGAGAAGIAAARRLSALGRRVLVLEAGGRLGGRAFTTEIAPGLPINHGAEWLHAADDNPLTPLARDLGIPLHEETAREERVLNGTRPADASDLAAYDRAWDGFDPAIAAAVAALPPGADTTLAAAAPRGGAWDATVTYWQAEVICGAPAAAMGLRDFWEVALEGRNLLPLPGIAALLERLAEGLPVRLSTPVARLSWDAAGCVAEGPGLAPLRAAAAIVTVSTGVLAAGGLQFAPALPPDVQAAIAALPLGQVEKVALPIAAPLDLPDFVRLERRVEHDGDRPATFICRPFGRPVITCWLGGSLAPEVARGGPEAGEAIARAELGRHLGAGTVARAIGPAALVTGWCTDPLFRGAYTYGRPGCGEARATLRDAAPGKGRLRFAGEACHARYGATVGGAWASGEHAAEQVHATLG